MKTLLKDGLTLVELLIAVALIGILAVGISSLATYANFFLVSSDRRAQVQNEASFVLEHMAKHLGQAISSVDYPGVIMLGTSRIRVRLDRNGNGQPDDDGANDWIAYIYDSGLNTITFYSQCSASAWPGGAGEILTEQASDFQVSYASADNYIFAYITTCWDADSPDCGSINIPESFMQARFALPAVSIN